MQIDKAELKTRIEKNTKHLGLSLISDIEQNGILCLEFYNESAMAQIQIDMKSGEYVFNLAPQNPPAKWTPMAAKYYEEVHEASAFLDRSVTVVNNYLLDIKKYN